MWNQRAQRARLLAERYHASREILTFYAGLAEWQGQVAVGDLHSVKSGFPSLLELVIQTGPPALAEAARGLDVTQFDQLVRDYWDSPGVFSELEFFARAVFQPYASSLPDGLDCPWCRQPPQVGCLRPQADGLAFELVCPLCFRRRAFPRTRCPGCNESSEKKLANYSSPEFPHLRLQACDTCHGYLMIVDLSRDPAAIPEVDELAGLPLDLWAAQEGFHKLQPNLAGI
jgi:FdhE protein